MFDHHKKSPWFAEKYDPSDFYVNLRRRVRKEGWKGRANQFLLELEEGRHDPQIVVGDDSTAIPADVPSPKQTVDQKPEPAKVEDRSGATDEDITFGIDAEDEPDNENKLENGSKTTFDTKTSPRNDEISVMPDGNEILIRTIPPDIGRVKLEEVRARFTFHISSRKSTPPSGLLRRSWICAPGFGRPIAKEKLLPCRLDQVRG